MEENEKWSKGRLHVEVLTGDQPYLVASNGTVIAAFGNFTVGDEVALANAHRVAECWNGFDEIGRQLVQSLNERDNEILLSVSLFKDRITELENQLAAAIKCPR